MTRFDSLNPTSTSAPNAAQEKQIACKILRAVFVPQSTLYLLLLCILSVSIVVAEHFPRPLSLNFFVRRDYGICRSLKCSQTR